MNLCDLIKPKDLVDMLKGFKESPEFDKEEEKKLKEKDEYPKAMVVDCLHHSKIYLTNGSVQCMRCKRMLKVVEPTWRK